MPERPADRGAAAAELAARVAAAREQAARAREQAARLLEEVRSDAAARPPAPGWGDERWQQQLRDGGGGDVGRRLQAEVDARRTTWDALAREGDLDPRHRAMLHEWREAVWAAVERGRGQEPDGDPAAEERAAAAWLRRRYDGEGSGPGSR